MASFDMWWGRDRTADPTGRLDRPCGALSRTSPRATGWRYLRGRSRSAWGAAPWAAVRAWAVTLAEQYGQHGLTGHPPADAAEVKIQEMPRAAAVSTATAITFRGRDMTRSLSVVGI